MRKLSISLLLGLFSLQVSAQLVDGSIAPDFTVFDLGGQKWDLYDHLNAGKIAVVHVAATWCVPCWAYHQSHALQDFYAANGPKGTNTVRVLFLEGDPLTASPCLYGLNNCNAYTPGNWVTAANFPIAESGSVAAAYNVTYYPTIYLICPNKKVYRLNQLDTARLNERAAGCPVAYGEKNAGIYYFDSGTEFSEVCHQLPVQPQLKLINVGSQKLTEAQVALRWNDQTVQTLKWSGSMELYDETTLKFDSLVVQKGGELVAELTSINYSNTDQQASNDLYKTVFTTAGNFPKTNLLLRLRTDMYGAETYWEVHDESGKVLDKGGNLNVGYAGGGQYPGGISDGPGAYNDQTTIRDTIRLPGPGCYSFHIVDAYGDGICCSHGSGFYKLFDLDKIDSPLLFGGEFETYEHRAFSVGDLTSTNEERMQDLFVYPNPASDAIFFTTTESVTGGSIQLYNINGTCVLSQTLAAGTESVRVPVHQLPAGIYYLQFQSDKNKSFRKKIAVQH